VVARGRVQLGMLEVVDEGEGQGAVRADGRSSLAGIDVGEPGNRQGQTPAVALTQTRMLESFTSA
jgi:hypothetical protein